MLASLNELVSDGSDFLRSGGFTGIGKVTHVLERVVLPFTTVLLVETHQVTEAIEVVHIESLSGVLAFKDGVEDSVYIHSVGEFFLKLIACLVGLLSDHLVVKVVKLNITRVDIVVRLRDVFLFNLGFGLVESTLEDVVS